MKALRLQFFFTTGLISLFIIITLSNCGQSGAEKNTKQVSAEEKQNTVATTSTTVDQPSTTTDTNLNSSGTQIKQTTAASEQTKSVTTTANKETKTVNPVTASEPVADKTVDKSIPVEVKPVEHVEEKPVKTEEVKTPTVNETKTVEPPKTVETPKTIETKPSQDGWIVPDKYRNMKDPYPSDKESLDLGKSLYATHCKSCHGNKGAGDGPKAAQIDTKIISFLSADFTSQTPGTLFYKTSFGRKDMPKFEKKIPDEEDRWAIVHYIMSLKN